MIEFCLKESSLKEFFYELRVILLTFLPFLSLLFNLFVSYL